MEYGEIGNSTDEVLEMNRKKKDFKIEMALFFILGFLLGVTFKTEAVKRVTIGFEDYKITAAKDAYSASEIKKKLLEEAEQASKAAEESATIEEGENEAEAVGGDNEQQAP